jgi:hypothetical protein
MLSLCCHRYVNYMEHLLLQKYKKRRIVKQPFLKVYQLKRIKFGRKTKLTLSLNPYYANVVNLFMLAAPAHKGFF